MKYTHAKRAVRIPGLSPAERVLLFTLADYADDRTAQAWPSRDRLIAVTDLSDKHIQRCLRRLEQLGYLSRGHASPGRTLTVQLYPDRWPDPPEPGCTARPAAP